MAEIYKYMPLIGGFGGAFLFLLLVAVITVIQIRTKFISRKTLIYLVFPSMLTIFGVMLSYLVWPIGSFNFFLRVLVALGFVIVAIIGTAIHVVLIYNRIFPGFLKRIFDEEAE